MLSGRGMGYVAYFLSSDMVGPDCRTRVADSPNVEVQD